jgi:single-strand DNA-binding protein
MLSINKAEYAGHLTDDATAHVTGNGNKNARFDIAVNKRWKKKDGTYGESVSYIPAVLWNGVSELLTPRLKKGTAVFVDGEMKSRKYEAKDGSKHNVLELNVRNIQVLTKNETTGGEEALAAAVSEEALAAAE